MFDQPTTPAPAAAPCHPPVSPPPTSPPSYPQPRSADRAWRYAGIGLVSLLAGAAVIWANLADRAPPPATASVEAIPPRAFEGFNPYPESGTPLPIETASAVTDDDVVTDDAASTPPALAPVAPVNPLQETVVRLEKGNTFAGVLRALGLSATQVANAVAALAPRVRLDRLAAGQAFAVTMRTEDGSPPILEALTFRPEVQRELTLERNDNGGYGVVERIFKTTARLHHAAGEVDGSLIASAEAAGVPRPALVEMLRGFSWDVNFQHDLKEGDRFAVLVEQSWTSDGLPVGGKVLWAEITTHAGRKTFSIYRFKPRSAREFFFDAHGNSVVKALLRTPLNMARISSRFGLRRHPILGFTRLHTGLDFAAPTGTPILAAGDGRVVEAGHNGGYGRWIKIDHGSGLATGYAHLSRLAAGMRRGKRVRQSQVIGFVGSSGLSTGPHLHFELHRQGRPINPQAVANTAARTRLAGQDLKRFKARMAEIDSARAATQATAVAAQ